MLFLMVDQTFVNPRVYYFDLTNGTELITDADGIEVPTVNLAFAHALAAIEELRRENASSSQHWSGWRLEIRDQFGRRLHSIALDSVE
jgi:hypothetical protein